MIWAYYFGFGLLLALAGPWLLLFKKKARAGLAEKLGRVPAQITAKGSKSRIWFHTVSVGEFNATYPLLMRFRDAHPDFEIFVSTTTATGQALAQDKAGKWSTVFYFPFDLPFATGAWLDRIQPDIVAIAETEIWPGFTDECKKRGIQLCAVNARISPRSFNNYKQLSFFFQPIMSAFSAIAAQSEQEAFRYRGLGAHESAVKVCGNMKFDGMRAISDEERDALRTQLNINPTDIVIVGGSTHEGEESALLQAITELNDKVAPGGRSLPMPPKYRFRLILVPRHPERFQRVFQVVEEYGYRVRCFSRNEAFERENDVYVLDTIGQLMRYYSQATIAFVGGTIAPIGGHSLVEPCTYKTPVICGPHVEKTRDVCRALLERNAIVQIKSADEMADALRKLTENEQLRHSIGAAGAAFLNDSQGAVEKTMQVIESLIPQLSTETASTTSQQQPVAAGTSARGEEHA